MNDSSTTHDSTCPACKGDGRPLCKDGSHNGNAGPCKTCGGTGKVEAPSFSSIEVDVLVTAVEAFCLGAGLFAPQLLEKPAFVRMYDAMQDAKAAGFGCDAS